MSDRLTELRRLRAHVQEQADWLDREIARHSGSETPATTPPPPAPNPAVAAPRTPEAAPFDEQLYTADPVAAGAEAKRGCFLYFTLALVLLAAALAGLYYLHYRDRPLLLMDKDAEPAGTAHAEH